MATEAQRKATAKYDRENTVKKMLKLNKTTDIDILKRFDEVGNVQGYIKSLIRNDIQNS